MKKKELPLEERKPWVPRVLMGGKGPPEPPPPEGVNWLGDMDEGTTFTCRNRRNKDVELNLYHLVFKHKEVALLAWRLPDGKMLDYYVDPVRFSRDNEHMTILGVQPEAEETEENDNGNSNRTNRPADLVLHEAVSGKHQLLDSSSGETTDLLDGDQR